MEGQSHQAWATSCEAVQAEVFPRASAGGSLSNRSCLDAKQIVIGDPQSQMLFECLVSVHDECKVQSLVKLSSAQHGDPEVSGRASGKSR
jgi:hypothetical protein